MKVHPMAAAIAEDQEEEPARRADGTSYDEPPLDRQTRRRNDDGSSNNGGDEEGGGDGEQTGGLKETIRSFLKFLMTPPGQALCMLGVISIIVWITGGFSGRAGGGSSGGRRSSSGSRSSRGSSGGGGGSSGGCFPPGTRILLENQSSVAIERLDIRDRVAHGGEVLAIMKLVGTSEPLMQVRVGGSDGGVIESFAVVSASHTVLDPSDGRWKHARDVLDAFELQRKEPVIYNAITERHKLAVIAKARVSNPTANQGQRSLLIATDFQEVDDDDELLARNLRQLNDAENEGRVDLPEL